MVIVLAHTDLSRTHTETRSSDGQLVHRRGPASRYEARGHSLEPLRNAMTTDTSGSTLELTPAPATAPVDRVRRRRRLGDRPNIPPNNAAGRVRNRRISGALETAPRAAVLAGESIVCRPSLTPPQHRPSTSRRVRTTPRSSQRQRPNGMAGRSRQSPVGATSVAVSSRREDETKIATTAPRGCGNEGVPMRS